MNKKYKIADEKLVVHAYEQTIIYASRLAAYATATPLQSDGPIYSKQELLALDDLAGFAYHARRLRDLTDTRKFFDKVIVTTVNPKHNLSINQLLGVIIHQDFLETIRYEWKLKILTARNQSEGIEAIIGAKNSPAFKPIVVVKSDRNDGVAFKLEDLMELFQDEALSKIIDVCHKGGIYLEEL
jgi:hypothetical protein